MTDPRYPIGKFHFDGPPTEEQRKKSIDDISQAPANLRAAVKGLSDKQLDTPYRPDGWTVRQVAHHVPDSHLNAYVRFKLALTEEEPTIKPYAEDRWAQLADTQATPVEVSLTMLDSLHDRWVRLLRSLQAGRLEALFSPSRAGPGEPGKEPRALLLARTPSRRAHHEPAGEKRLVRGGSQLRRSPTVLVIPSKARDLGFSVRGDNARSS